MVTPQCQIGLAAEQRFQRARQGFGPDAQTRRRAQGVERFTQFEQRGARDQGIGRNGELGLPAGGNALDPLGHGVQFLQQVLTGPQQFLPAGVSWARRERRSNSSTSSAPRPGARGRSARWAPGPARGRRRPCCPVRDTVDQVQVFRRQGGALFLHGDPLGNSNELNNASKSLRRHLQGAGLQ
jgi:hypothetical protein